MLITSRPSGSTRAWPSLQEGSIGYDRSDRGAGDAVANGALLPLHRPDRRLPAEAPGPVPTWRTRRACRRSTSSCARTGRRTSCSSSARTQAGVTDDEAFKAAAGVDVAGFQAAWLADLGGRHPSSTARNPRRRPVPSGWRRGRPPRRRPGRRRPHRPGPLGQRARRRRWPARRPRHRQLAARAARAAVTRASSSQSSAWPGWSSGRDRPLACGGGLPGSADP